jgi:hypothetical protein
VLLASPLWPHRAQAAPPIPNIFNMTHSFFRLLSSQAILAAAGPARFARDNRAHFK